MAIKIIKFDLPINGTKVTTLEALRDNPSRYTQLPRP